MLSLLPKCHARLATSFFPAVEGVACSCAPSVWLLCCMVCASVSSSMIWVPATSPAKARSDSKLHCMDLWAESQRLFLFPRDIACITKTVWFLSCCPRQKAQRRAFLLLSVWFSWPSFPSFLFLPSFSGTLFWVLSSVAGTSSGTARTQLLWVYHSGAKPSPCTAAAHTANADYCWQMQQSKPWVLMICTYLQSSAHC